MGEQRGRRYDWAAIRAFYVAMPPPRSLAVVAKHFGVGRTSLRKWARAEGWVELAAEADRRAGEQALAKAGRTLTERHAQILRIADRTFDLVEASLGGPGKDPELALELVFQRVPEIHRIYRLEIGEATDHVALAEVQAGFRTSMRTAVEIVAVLAGELLSPVEAAAFVEGFRVRYFAAVNEALAIGGGGDA